MNPQRGLNQSQPATFFQMVEVERPQTPGLVARPDNVRTQDKFQREHDS